ncbi:putative fatty acyl-CoA reductase CG5065 [Tribolium castaneum]|uniref:Fatty acyl-CoA reductase n=1 Tax=Tribolium castaneum TaxID=7070 RepID=D2A4J7_TRICA|nr:PREDICTED: putative fatty acyl-CoA reductase CG5065 [Tribolium castaneum]EFA05233.2 Putative fatty acyl-CoA reductase CG5065-like Protein [Tribolium castaneum]|eukprot:XP_001811309.1 PREDICTED: putative fatty acyl-CoA reductase CG5065 [Tribolium castaneum]
MDPSNHDEYPDRVAETFVDRTLLITGGTGFVGKVFVEKLLRSCPGIKKIYLFIRTKKDKEPNERIREMFNGPLFDLLKKQQGDEILKKVEAISADMEAPDLALAASDRKKLAEEVEMIYHCAATIRFDESLRKAVFLNTRGTKLMLDLAKECKKLIVFAHLSTAYCHLHERVLYEKAYPPPTSPHHVIKACEWLDEKALDTITDKILGDIPNTYAFTKALGESLVNDEMENLPTIILRPSVIIPIWKEPLPGWTDNINGPIGLLIGAGKGVIRTMYCKGESYADYIPVDIVANCLICSTFIYLQSNKRIFNLTSSAEYKVSFDEIIEIGRNVVSNKIPLNGVLWYPGGSMKRSRWHHNVDFFLFQLVPAVFLDALLIVLGYKPVLMRVQKRVSKGYEVFEYYANNQWDFNNDDSMKARQMLNPKERAIYKLDGDGIDYHDYFTDCVRAARLYILKEGDETIPSARRHMRLMRFVDVTCKTLLLFAFLYMLYKYLV